MEEDKTILSTHSTMGNRWAELAKFLPGKFTVSVVIVVAVTIIIAFIAIISIFAMFVITVIIRNY